MHRAGVLRMKLSPPLAVGLRDSLIAPLPAPPRGCGMTALQRGESSLAPASCQSACLILSGEWSFVAVPARAWGSFNAEGIG